MGETVLHLAAMAGNHKVIVLFVSADRNLNKESISRNTHIHCLAYATQHFPQTLETMLKLGANIEKVDKYGNKLLLLAMCKGISKENFKYILHYSPNLYHSNNKN